MHMLLASEKMSILHQIMRLQENVSVITIQSKHDRYLPLDIGIEEMLRCHILCHCYVFELHCVACHFLHFPSIKYTVPS